MHLKLAKFSELPKYEALSYMWGPPKLIKLILVDGADFEVRENLWVELQHLRLDSKPRVLWVDAICISQRNIYERDYQVNQMAQIYEQATRVIVWHGASEASQQTCHEAHLLLSRRNTIYPTVNRSESTR
jgi:hypothetical protein